MLLIGPSSVRDPDPVPDPQVPHVDPDLLVRGTDPAPDPNFFLINVLSGLKYSNVCKIKFSPKFLAKNKFF